MLRPLCFGLLTCSCLVLCVSADNDNDNDFAHCNCHDDGFLSLQTILDCQKVSDFLIAIAYFSIPIEILYFVSFSNLPFKWVFFQFIAFIVLCGLTHLINAWTYYGPHSFRLMLSLTVAKFLTALVSCATAITLFTLFPLLLKVKVRELFLRQNVLELDQEVGMMKRQKEASWHVRMLTREIRKSLDKHTILYTTLVELSKTLDLRNCAVWLPDEQRTRMSLFHELNAGPFKPRPIPIEDDPDIAEIIGDERVRILRAGSALGEAARRGGPGSVAAIRMPMLRVSNFKGGTPEMVDTWYAVLVLVHSREWSPHEMEIVEVVADQVAVALSHADVLEESQIMREKLAEQNRALQRAKKSAVMASRARVTFQKVMSHGMRRPMHSILGLLSMLKEDNIERTIVVDTMIRTGDVLSALINDSMEVSDREPLRSRPFELHSMIREAACLVKCLCMSRGFDFGAEARGSVPNRVVGDETRAFQVILHVVGYLLSLHGGGGGGVGTAAAFRVSSESAGDDRFKVLWRSSAVVDEFVSVKFEFEIGRRADSRPETDFDGRSYNGGGEMKEGLSFSICKRLVQMMQGDVWISPSSEGSPQSMTLVLRFQTQPSFKQPSFASGISPDHHHNHHHHHHNHQPRSNPSLRGLRVILADDDDVNRTVTKKLLEKLGCQVTAVSSGLECLGAVTAASAESPCRVVLLDIHMPEMDGFEVAGRIRKFRSRSWPLIVAVTASAEDHVWERCLQMGMNGLIRKPVVLQGLADELRRVLLRAGEGL